MTACVLDVSRLVSLCVRVLCYHGKMYDTIRHRSDFQYSTRCLYFCHCGSSMRRSSQRTLPLRSWDQNEDRSIYSTGLILYGLTGNINENISINAPNLSSSIVSNRTERKLNEQNCLPAHSQAQGDSALPGQPPRPQTPGLTGPFIHKQMSLSQMFKQTHSRLKKKGGILKELRTWISVPTDWVNTLILLFSTWFLYLFASTTCSVG